MIFLEDSNVICYDLHTITRLSSGCRNLHSECKATYNNFLVIWDKVALDESDIVHKLTQNTLLPDAEYFENPVPKLPRGCRIEYCI